MTTYLLTAYFQLSINPYLFPWLSETERTSLYVKLSLLNFFIAI